MHIKIPPAAVRCMQDLGARKVLATHWSTLPLMFEPMAASPQHFAVAMEKAGLLAENFTVWRY